MKPWFGLHLPNFTFADTTPATLFNRVVEQAKAASPAGFGAVTVMDHLYQIGGLGTKDQEMLEGWSVLNALARETKKCPAGDVGHRRHLPQSGDAGEDGNDARRRIRWPRDIRPGGSVERGGARRVRLRLPGCQGAHGSAGRGADHRTGHVPRGAAHHRGRYYQVHEIVNSPLPVQPGGPRIMVGGGGEQRTLRIAARHADMTHWFSLGLETLAHKNELLVRYAEDIGRDPATIERTMGAPVIVASDDARRQQLLERIPEERRPFVKIGGPEQAADVMRPYLDAGFSGFTFNNNLYATPDQIAEVGEVLRLIGG